MKRYNVITKLLILSILITALSFSSCKKDDEFSSELIPIEYTGIMTYWASIDGGGRGNSIPELSKAIDYKTTITKIGSNYILSFDKSFIYTIPDINVEISWAYNAEIVAIRTLEGQAFTSVELDHYLDYPPNYFSIDKIIRRADCNLTLKSNDPDSIYYLTFTLYQIY